MTSLSTSALLQPSETRQTVRVAGGGASWVCFTEWPLVRRVRRAEEERLKGAARIAAGCAEILKSQIAISNNSFENNGLRAAPGHIASSAAPNSTTLPRLRRVAVLACRP